MKYAYILCKDGLEEIECLTQVDYLRRAGIKIFSVSMTGDRMIRGAHGIKFKTDVLFEDTDFSDADCVILPGGMPGTTSLDEDSRVHELIKRMFSEGKLVAAICAAPSILAHAGILSGRRATCYPGCEVEGAGVEWCSDMTATDGNIITGKGPGAAAAFAVEIVRYMLGDGAADELRASAILKV